MIPHTAPNSSNRNMAGTVRLVSSINVPASPIAAITQPVLISLMPSVMKLSPSPNTIPMITKRGTILAMPVAAPLNPRASHINPVTRPAA